MNDFAQDWRLNKLSLKTTLIEKNTFEFACIYLLCPVWKNSTSHIEKTMLKYEITKFYGELIKLMTLQ